MRFSLPLPFPSRWRARILLYGVGLAVSLVTFFMVHPFTYLGLGHTLFRSLMMPTIMFWMMDTLFYGQECEAVLASCFALLHAGYFTNSGLPMQLCAISALWLLFLILSINTFHFSWDALPRHVIESALLYAPELGLLTNEYDRLIDEMGYNEWYARYRTLWLVTIGLALGALMTISYFFILLGVVLGIIYALVSSSYESMLKKMATIFLPAAFILLLEYIASPAYFTLGTFKPHITFEMLMKFSHYLFVPSFSTLLVSSDLSWTQMIFKYGVLGIEILYTIGWIGLWWAIARAEFVSKRILVLFPFLGAFVVAAICENQAQLFWVMYPSIAVVGSVFWSRLIRRNCSECCP